MYFKMNNVTYQIIELSQKDYKTYRKAEDKHVDCEETDTNKGVYFGATHCYRNIVFLDKSLPIDRKRKTLIHELTHCYIAEYITHEETQFNEELVADISANSHDIIHKIVTEYFDSIEKENI